MSAGQPPAPVRLQQLSVEFDAEQDRLLLRISTSAGSEFRLWITRRYLKLLWTALLKLAEALHPQTQVQANPEARRALVGMEHEQAVSQADFSKPFEAKPRATPLGEAPLLLARIEGGKSPAGLPMLALHPAQGHGVTLTLDPVLLHSLLRLLAQAATQAGWDLALPLPTPLSAQASGERVVN